MRLLYPFSHVFRGVGTGVHRLTVKCRVMIVWLPSLGSLIVLNHSYYTRTISSWFSVLCSHRTEDNQPYIFGSVIMKTKLATNYYFGNKLIIQKDLRGPKESVQRRIQTVLSRKLFIKNQFPPKPFLCQLDIILVTKNTFDCLLVFSERNRHRCANQSCKYSTQNKLCSEL